ncbi:MAG TPA: c-type cytochrome [Acidobacteriaceae bacterium]
MRQASTVFALAGLTLAVYVGSIVGGLRVKDLSSLQGTIERHPGTAWKAPSPDSIPNNAKGDSIRRGLLIFNETPLYASRYTGAKLSCSSCHAEAGMQPFASPVVDLPALFPMYNERAGHIISLRDRIQECFVRSENGRPLEYDGEPMRNIVDYINWLSTPQPNRQPFRGRGLVSLPDRKPDPVHGRAIYAMQCAGCHGDSGEGRAPLFPPLYGNDSFNDGAGMNGMRKMAAFVQHNMPQNRKGLLSPQDAFDVSAYIHEQPRPSFNNAYKKF